MSEETIRQIEFQRKLLLLLESIAKSLKEIKEQLTEGISVYPEEIEKKIEE